VSENFHGAILKLIRLPTHKYSLQEEVNTPIIFHIRYLQDRQVLLYGKLAINRNVTKWSKCCAQFHFANFNAPSPCHL